MNQQQLEVIYQAIKDIPPGRVASYSLVAKVAGLPGRARLVGYVLRHTPDHIKLPWHRVLRADGQIAFPKGSPAFEEQIQRLATEGVLVRNGRVSLAHFGWDASLDRLLWGPGDF
jgi:methylated-DNA-protein-cysteine methyltransferase-like protein